MATAWDVKKVLGTDNQYYDLYVAGTYWELTEVIFDEATAGYTPAVGDVLCYKTDDTNKHTRYDETDKANLVILGIVDEIKEDNSSPTPDVILSFAVNATVHYAALGADGVDTDAKKLVLVNDLRAKNINVAV